MDSIKNAATSVANTASSYIYGNQNAAGTEPAAGGETGKGTAQESYDKGNEAPSTDPEPAKSASNTGFSGTQHESQTLSSQSLEELYLNHNPRYQGGRRIGSYHRPPPGSETRAAQPSEPSAASAGAGLGSTNPSTGADPASAPKLEQKQQGADRPNEAPTGAAADAVAEKKEEGEEALKKRDPNDHSGEPMHMHDGSESDKGKEGEHPGQEGGGEHGQGEGTGEKWVKTSGLKADGGDFDAAQAGAGREADRLLEEKGIKKDDRGGMVDGEGNSASPERAKTDHDGGKHGSKMDRLKEKLHIGTGKKM